jgi:hypothetical protein
MTTLLQSRAQLIVFVLTDSGGMEVTGLGSGCSVALAKNGADFATGAGAKDEIGNGWYSYQLSAADTDTVGPLAVKVTGTGVKQVNLTYEISGSVVVVGEGPNILSAAEAAIVLRCSIDDTDMLVLLPMIDKYIIGATGRDWTEESPIREEAKSAARMLLVMWHENPAMIGSVGVLEFGLNAALTQLEAIALRYRRYKFYGGNGAGSIALRDAAVGDTVESLIGIYIASGDASNAFEATVSVDGCLQQTSGSDLSKNLYLAVLKAADALDP